MRISINLVLVILLTAAAVNTAAYGHAEKYDRKPNLDLAVRTIDEQIEWFGSSRYSREFLAAVATMNFVQSRVSPLNYSLLVQAQKDLPLTPEECLQQQAGICGGQVQTFQAIMSRLKVRTRPIEFYLHGKTPAENRNHIGAEVFYQEGWHFFDITWGAFFRRPEEGTDQVMSISKLLQTDAPLELAVANQSDLWYQQWTANGLDPFAYLTSPERDVVIGGGGTVRLRPARRANGDLEFAPVHQPNYVGRNNSSVDSGTLEFQVGGLGNVDGHLKLHVLGVAGEGVLAITYGQLSIRRPLAELNPGTTEFELPGIKDSQQLSVGVTTQDRKVGYVVIKKLQFRTSRPR